MLSVLQAKDKKLSCDTLPVVARLLKCDSGVACRLSRAGHGREMLGLKEGDRENKEKGR
jgi:hypothetical protein